jgi:hypothetical protein
MDDVVQYSWSTEATQGGSFCVHVVEQRITGVNTTRNPTHAELLAMRQSDYVSRYFVL